MRQCVTIRAHDRGGVKFIVGETSSRLRPVPRASMGYLIVAIVALATFSCTRPVRLASGRVPMPAPPSAGQTPEAVDRNRNGGEDRRQESGDLGRDHHLDARLDRNPDARDSEEAAEQASR